MKSISALSRLKTSFAFPALLACCLGAYAQAKPAAEAPVKPDTVAPKINVDMLAQIKKAGKLRVGVSEAVPWAMHNKDGKWIGFSIDLARKVARDIGVEVEFHPTPFAYLIPDLLADQYDIIISGFFIKPDRALEVNFSEPYNTTDVMLAVNLKTTAGLQALDDFNNSKLKIGAVEGSAAEQMSSNLLPNAQIRAYSADKEMFGDLANGKLDAVAADSPGPQIVASAYPQMIGCPPGIKLSTFPSGFAVRRGDMDFVNFLNAWIAARTADQWLDSRKAYWFRTMEWSKNL
jgi:polar amino acid transport system substrate-binding protein